MITRLLNSLRENKGVRIANQLADAELLLLLNESNFEDAEANIGLYKKRIARLKKELADIAKAAEPKPLKNPFAVLKKEKP